MLEGREQLKREVVQAAMIHYQLQEAGRVYPVVQELQLERPERADFTYKFAVLIAGRPAIVYRDWDGAYKVVDDPERQLSTEEQEEREAYQVLVTAAHYLEADLGRVGSLEVQDVTAPIAKGAAITQSWFIRLNNESCTVDRYDEQDGPCCLT